MFQQGDRVRMVGSDGYPKYGEVQYVHSDGDGEARVIGVRTSFPAKLGTHPHYRELHTFYARKDGFYLAGQKTVFHNKLRPVR